jgi:hypothetical protein
VTASTLQLDEAELRALLERIRSQVAAADFLLVAGLAETLRQIAAHLEHSHATIRELKHLLFGPRTEKVQPVGPSAAPAPTAASPGPAPALRGKRPGHGRLAAAQYTGGTTIAVAHQTLPSGCLCPACQRGKLYRYGTPAPVLRFKASVPVTSQTYLLEKLRCNACQAVFTAALPPEAGAHKYDTSVQVAIAEQRYATGVPHNRLAQLQAMAGIPLPTGTQWEVLAPLAATAITVTKALWVEAAQAHLIHNDDTEMVVLDLRRPGAVCEQPIPPKRKGTFTTNLLAEVGSIKIALFRTGWKHAGENLADLFALRDPNLPNPIQMSDALSRNLSEAAPTQQANCLVHARRKVVPHVDYLPSECDFVLKSVQSVYAVELECRKEALTPQARLQRHQKKSGPVMGKLKQWIKAQFDQKKIEPNSAFGKALGYFQEHWKKLTLFLRVAGAPIDNNVAERLLKMAILHRKNSLFYKTNHGAEVGDAFMSLFQTCRLNGANVHHYLTALAEHPDEVKAAPHAWLPWNYPGSPHQPTSNHPP